MSDFEQERFKKGMDVLQKMGREETMMNQKRIYPDLYDLSVGYLFGEIWSRGHLSLRDRELITMACNISLARPNGTHSHYRSAKHIGITPRGDHGADHPGRSLRRLAGDGARPHPVRGSAERGRGEREKEERDAMDVT